MVKGVVRDQPENISGQKPMDAARRSGRPALRQRFFGRAAAAAVDGGYAVQLDGKPVRTPARRLLTAPTRSLAEAIAGEWEAQREAIDPKTMPLTRLANAIIDGVGENRVPVTAEIERYLASDLLFYRADALRGLVERQARYWDPILTWARQTLGAEFRLGHGIMHVAQPEAALAAARAAIPGDPWRLGAMHAVTTLTGSALIALALARGHLSADAAWQAAHVDEDWNMEHWGRDALALERREFHFAAFKAAARMLASLSE